jgi:hypothetical protein
LFRTGDMDDSIFVVAKGEIEVCGAVHCCTAWNAYHVERRMYIQIEAQSSHL